MGVMTQYLYPKSREFKCVEIDRESVAYLTETFPKLRGGIIGDDFLKMDLREVFGGQQFVLTGNYPYDISSQIFFKMLDNKELIPCCTGMIQREVALRIAAEPGNKQYGILSVLIQASHHGRHGVVSVLVKDRLSGNIALPGRPQNGAALGEDAGQIVPAQADVL